MLDFDDALGRVLAQARETGSEGVPLGEARGRVLSSAIYATRALPEFDHSAMDGYALACADAASLRLPVRGESRAGAPMGRLEPGFACRIYTGAALPEGADSVVIQEDVERIGDEIVLGHLPVLGDNVRRRGEDLGPGQLALRQGTRLGPGQLGFLAALDHASCEVSRRPRVAVLCTGDELRPAGSPVRPGSIPESNAIAVTALAESAGATVLPPRLVPDDEAEIVAAFRSALAASDVVVSVGGVSAGDRDLVRPALERLGATLDFWKIRIKPGKPFLLGCAGSTTILGLPGNPVSAYVTFTLLGVPLLRAMQRDAHPEPPERTATLALPVRQKPGRLGFYRAVLQGDVVTPLANQASGAVTSVAWANALIRVPAESTGYERGAEVSVILLDQP